MRLTPAVAAEIVSRARLVLNRTVLVTDARGVVLGDGEREHKIMVDALRACQEGRVIRAELDDDLVAWCPFVYENQTIGAFGIIEESLRITPEAIGLLQGLAEVIAHQHFLLDHIQPTEKMRATFLHQVLSSTKINPNEAYRQADILQMNLRLPQAILLVDVENLEAKLTKPAASPSSEAYNNRLAEHTNKIRSKILEAFQNSGGIISSYIGQNQFVVSKCITGENLTTRNTTRFLIEKAAYLHEISRKAFPDHKFTIGVGQYYPDLGGLRKSYQEAKLALSVGSKVWESGRIYHIKQVGMYVTLANVAQEHKAELAHQILHPLLQDEQLYKTVQTFLAAGLNLTEAAEQLHVHRNTLIYRLDKTKKIIGLDPRVFDDALQIKLGLMFYQEV
ncbi:MAG TPA: helix-turn-helix domain-containing protein [Candidatus Polarisedimenticolaceae bacterium]|nr:helix-turn-helix domain-containing protein [Candidatus Polarisedimenticolaceae bacterium]